MIPRSFLFVKSTGAFLFSIEGAAQTEPIGTSVEDFTAEWVAGDPNLAIEKRYFSGDRQDRLERELTPETSAYQREHIALARSGSSPSFIPCVRCVTPKALWPAWSTSMSG